MMSLGIIQMVSLATTLVFALPVAIFGIRQALSGSVFLGTTLTVVAALMIIIPQRVVTPGDIPTTLLERFTHCALSQEDDQ